MRRFIATTMALLGATAALAACGSSALSQSLAFTSTGRTTTPCSRASPTICAGA